MQAVDHTPATAGTADRVRLKAARQGGPSGQNPVTAGRMSLMSGRAPGFQKMLIGKSHTGTAGEVTGEIVQDRLEHVIQVGRPFRHINVGVEAKVHPRRQEPPARREENLDRGPGWAAGVPFDASRREGVMNALTEPSVKPGQIRPAQLGQEIPLVRFPSLSTQTQQIDKAQEPLIRCQITHNLSQDMGGKGGQDRRPHLQPSDLEEIKLLGAKAVLSTGTEGLTSTAPPSGS